MADKLFAWYWYTPQTANLIAFDFENKTTTTFWNAPTGPWDSSTGYSRLVTADVLDNGKRQPCLFQMENGGPYNGKTNFYVFDFETHQLTPFAPQPEQLSNGFSFGAGDVLGTGYAQLLTSGIGAGAGTYMPVNIFAIDFKSKAISQFWPAAQGGWDVKRLAAGDVLGLGYDQVLIFDNNNSVSIGTTNLFAFDFKTKSQTPFWSSPLQWNVGDIEMIAGDFLGLGYDQVCIYHDYAYNSGVATNFLLLDFKTKGVTLFYQTGNVAPWGYISSVRMVAADVMGSGYQQVCFFQGDINPRLTAPVNIYALDFKTQAVNSFYPAPNANWIARNMLVNQDAIDAFPVFGGPGPGGPRPFPQLYCVTAYDGNGGSLGSFNFRAVSAADAQTQAEKQGWGGPGAVYQAAAGCC